jgi:hypothetical protein
MKEILISKLQRSCAKPKIDIEGIEWRDQPVGQQTKGEMTGQNSRKSAFLLGLLQFQTEGIGFFWRTQKTWSKSRSSLSERLALRFLAIPSVSHFISCLMK